jgi:transcription termination factor Rho
MSLDLADLRSRRLTELVEMGRDLGIDNSGSLRTQELVFEIVRREAGIGGAHGEGVLEILADGFGFLRSPHCNYLSGPDDIYVSPSQIRRFNLRTGDAVRGQIRAPKEGERYFALIKIEEVNGRHPDQERHKLLFDNLAPVHPTEPLRFSAAPASEGLQLIDLFAPLAFGQRVAIQQAPGSGGTTLMRDMVEALRELRPDLSMLMVLVSERPEEAIELQRELPCDVLASTFDENGARHIQVAEMGLERAKRMVEQGRDVLLFIDSLTDLARAYNENATPGGRTLAGGFDAGALHKLRRYVAAGRNTEDEGSLTIIGTVLTGTGSPEDAALVQELRGCMNVTLTLSGELAELGHFPALDLGASRSRRPEVYLPEDQLDQLDALRDGLTGQAADDLERMLVHLEKSQLDKKALVGK